MNYSFVSLRLLIVRAENTHFRIIIYFKELEIARDNKLGPSYYFYFIDFKTVFILLDTIQGC